MKYIIIKDGRKVRDTHFPLYSFFSTLGVFLVMSGVHSGLTLLLVSSGIHPGLLTMLIIMYWVIVSILFTVHTGWQMRKAYEKPMKEIAEATSKVAHGDFSVYVPTIHTAEKFDYLDVMIMDFNKMVEELGSIETLKTDFFSNVSHEIKTPISVIQNSAEMLRNLNITTEEAQEYVTAIIQSSKKLTSLITNILKLNKLEKQNIQPVMEEFDLCKQLVDCSLQFEQIWEEKNIEFEVNIEEKAMVCCDASLLELVWTNLLSNGLKFTPEYGKVKLTQFSKQKKIVVQIQDSGCGMDKKTLEHLFDKFYQGDTSRHTEGNGLGLALAHRIVTMMEGTILVVSETNKGTTFTVTIPNKISERGEKYYGRN